MAANPYAQLHLGYTRGAQYTSLDKKGQLETLTRNVYDLI